jgi:hypothetical protein
LTTLFRCFNIFLLNQQLDLLQSHTPSAQSAVATVQTTKKNTTLCVPDNSAEAMVSRLWKSKLSTDESVSYNHSQCMHANDLQHYIQLDQQQPSQSSSFPSLSLRFVDMAESDSVDASANVERLEEGEVVDPQDIDKIGEQQTTVGGIESVDFGEHARAFESVTGLPKGSLFEPAGVETLENRMSVDDEDTDEGNKQRLSIPCVDASERSSLSLRSVDMAESVSVDASANVERLAGEVVDPQDIDKIGEQQTTVGGIESVDFGEHARAFESVTGLPKGSLFEPAGVETLENRMSVDDEDTDEGNKQRLSIPCVDASERSSLSLRSVDMAESVSVDASANVERLEGEVVDPQDIDKIGEQQTTVGGIESVDFGEHARAFESVTGLQKGSLFEPAGVETLENRMSVDDEDTDEGNKQRLSIPCVDASERSSLSLRSVDMAESVSVDASANVERLEGEVVDPQDIDKIGEQQTTVGGIESVDFGEHARAFESVTGLPKGSLFEPAGVETLENRMSVDDEDTDEGNKQRLSIPCVDASERSSLSLRSVDIVESVSVDASANVERLEEGEVVDSQDIDKIGEQQTTVGGIESVDFGEHARAFESVTGLQKGSLFEPAGVETLENRMSVDDEDTDEGNKQRLSIPCVDASERSSLSLRSVDMAESVSVDASANVERLAGEVVDPQDIDKIGEQQTTVGGIESVDFGEHARAFESATGLPKGSLFEPAGVETLENRMSVDDEDTDEGNKQRLSIPCVDASERSSLSLRSVDMAESVSVDASANVERLEGEVVDPQDIDKIGEQQTTVGGIESVDFGEHARAFESVTGLPKGSLFEPAGVETLENRMSVDDEDTDEGNKQRLLIPCVDASERSSLSLRSVDIVESVSVDASANVERLEEGEVVDSQDIDKIGEQQTTVGGIESVDFGEHARAFESVTGLQKGSLFEPAGVETLENRMSVDDEDTDEGNKQRLSIPCVDASERSSLSLRSVDMAESVSVDASANVERLEEGEVVDSQDIDKIGEQQTTVGGIESVDFGEHARAFESVTGLPKGSLFEPAGVETLENRLSVDDEDTDEGSKQRLSIPCVDASERSSLSLRSVDMAESVSVDASANVERLEGEVVDPQDIDKIGEQQTTVGGIESVDFGEHARAFESVTGLPKGSLFEPAGVETLENRLSVDDEDTDEGNKQRLSIPCVDASERSSLSLRSVDMAESVSVDASANVERLEGEVVDPQDIDKIGEQQTTVGGIDCGELVEDDVSLLPNVVKCAITLENVRSDHAACYVECASEAETVVGSEESEDESGFWSKSMNKKLETLKFKLDASKVSRQARSKLVEKMLGIIFCESQLDGGDVRKTYEQKSAIGSVSCGVSFSKQLASKLENSGNTAAECSDENDSGQPLSLQRR